MPETLAILPAGTLVSTLKFDRVLYCIAKSNRSLDKFSLALVTLSVSKIMQITVLTLSIKVLKIFWQVLAI